MAQGDLLTYESASQVSSWRSELECHPPAKSLLCGQDGQTRLTGN